MAYRSGIGWRLFDAASTRLDRRYGWDRLPRPVALGVLIGLRNELRRHNLHDTGIVPQLPRPVPPPGDPEARSADGTRNDPSDPWMGAAGTRFGRNVPLAAVDPRPEDHLLHPNPREVSRRLLTRTEFQPATTVNVLVAAWLQFMVKDWFSHGSGDADAGYRVPLSADDPFPQQPMVVPRTIPDPTRPPGTEGTPTFVNTLTHWWDLSSVYGTTEAQQQRIRTHQGGRLAIAPGSVMPLPDDDPEADVTRVPGWWVGLGMMASLFALEHNAICDGLRAEHPSWTDQQLFDKARLINAAVAAKIHTIEWTPAVIAHPTTEYAMRANWFGVAGERLHRAVGRLGRSEVVSGIPGSPTDHYGVPYSLTEEFAAVYRMHPLVPDDYLLRSVAGAPERAVDFAELAGPASRAVFAERSLADLFYSFGTAYAGAIVLHNYPRGLQQFTRPDNGLPMDIAAVDLLRIREFGVPRYNEFRRLLRLHPVRDFAELSDHPQTVRDLRELYDDDVEQLDLMIGMFAEERPTGFAFSDTAFRIFILMASRRLNSDRFFTRDYDARVYTRFGTRWIDDATMSGVLLRHLPALAPHLPATSNAFKPWG
ncbi:peroxidase family protein [Motilibacter rhizosphaerae]|uniref:peroxidase family protein n=1 Tax=Motilibacter rhizosphaerae TaxID=598652 RepID=UPI001E457F01|nr:peroxidase family protein [Motilibacter rhizosphaerae]